MPHASWRTWLFCAVALASLGGCRVVASRGLPEDPLFVRKSPTRLRGEFAPPVQVAYSEPSAPVDGHLAQQLAAAAEHKDRSMAQRLPDHATPPSQRSVPGLLVNRPNE